MKKSERPDAVGLTTPEKRSASKPASSKQAVETFLQAAKATSNETGGRLVFALDATMSRQPTWDAACRIQAEMFNAVGRVGGLSVQLVYFRGFSECRASRWVGQTEELRDLMTRIDCRGGRTQIGRVLSHVRNETARKPVSACVYIGDAMEESVDALCQKAGELGMRRVPCFMFHEGADTAAENAFREIARLSNGAYFHFDDKAAARLGELLKAVAVYAAGGRAALEGAGTREARLLLAQLRGGGGGR